MLSKSALKIICGEPRLLKHQLSQLRFASGGSGIKTPLYDLHVNNGGKMVNFCGFQLPVQYTDLSVSASHLHTRKNASIFDVSHMLQTRVSGNDCIAWFESICPVDLQYMRIGSSALTVFLNEKGGILDDLIVTKIDDKNLYVVSNAGRLEADKQHMTETAERFQKKGKDIRIEFWNVGNRGLIALQGPKAIASLQKVTKLPLNELYFMNSTNGTVAGEDNCIITRCGYTGEDGVEISVSADKTHHITEALLEISDIKLAGLGARDSLRLEAGLCLYGNDIDETITPVEANLTWLIAKRRRGEGSFMGAETVLRQIKSGGSRRRIGIRIETGPPARKDTVIHFDGKEVGKITSGCPSPSLGGNVAMGYVEESLKKVGTTLAVNVRGKDLPCVVTKMPFVPAKYYIKK